MRVGSVAGALVLLAQGLAMVPANAAPGPSVSWDQTDLSLSVYSGSVADAEVGFSFTGDVQSLDVKIVGAFANSVTVDTKRIRTTSPGHGVAPVHVEMPASPPSDYNANIQWMVDGRPQARPLHLVVTPQTLDPNVIPETSAFPADWRIGETGGGTTVVIDQMVVVISPDDPSPDQTIKSIAANISGQVVGSIPDLRRYQVRVPGATISAIESHMDQVEQMPNVVSANYDVLVQTSAYTNDPVWQPSPGAKSDQNWNLVQIDAPGAWDLSMGKNVDVAVLDSGIDAGHPDLPRNLKVINGNANSEIDHGTHTSGTVCARSNNGIGIVGVAPDCNLSMYSVYTQNKSMSGEDIVRNIDRINSMPPFKVGAPVDPAKPTAPRVVNVSIVNETTFDCTSPIAQVVRMRDIKAVQDARTAMSGLLGKRQDVMWVFSAGNESGHDSSCSAYGDLGNNDALPNVVTVAASDRNANIASYSVRGRGVTVAAPGGEQGIQGSGVYSTLPQFCIPAAAGQCISVAYGYMPGTSMAAPHVSGVAALAFGANPLLTPADVKGCLVSGAKTGGKPIAGQNFSIINAKKTVECAKAGPVSSANPVKSFTTNARSAFAERADGSVWAWGDNTSGQLGIGDSIVTNSLPTPIPGLTGVKEVVTGLSTTFALMDDGTVRAWGDNSHGLLGNGTTNNANAPQPVPCLSGVKSIVVNESDTPSMGFGYTPGLPGNTVFAVKNDGTVLAWGDNPSGVLGNGTTTPALVPTPVQNLTGAVSVSSQGGTAWAVKNDGTIASWGDNTEGQLGIGQASRTPALTAQPVAISNVTSIQAGFHALVALKDDGTVWNWGGSWGLTNTDTYQPAPVQKANLSNISKISVMRNTGVAIKKDGTAWGWGWNGGGEAGVGIPGVYSGGTWANSTVQPTQMPSISNVTDIRVGMALTADGSSWQWARMIFGVAPINDLSPTRAVDGAASILPVTSTRWVVKNDGTLWGWGRSNNFGLQYAPTQVLG